MSTRETTNPGRYEAPRFDPVEDLASTEDAEDLRVEELARQLHAIAVDLCDTVTPYWRGLSLLERRYLRDRARGLLKDRVV